MISPFKYIHGLAARGVHYLHRPGPTLQDVGFFLLPELGQDKAYISETLFIFVFLSFVLVLTFDFSLAISSAHLVSLLDLARDKGEWCGEGGYLLSHSYICLTASLCMFCFLQASQILRIITFYSTQLPGPNYHCREGSKLATLPPPDSVLEVFLINFPRGIIYGCGDLIFSSHMIFTLVFVLTYQKYGTRSGMFSGVGKKICIRCIKQLGWLVAVIQSLLIIASRKHYTVDVIVAWYTVNLVVFFIDKILSELPDRTNGTTFPLLPLNTKDKDGRTKEEHHKLLNGNSGDTADWRQRTQVNGKVLENGNTVHVDSAMNGA
ncbi:hypothetical protein HHK36_018493 [Tetracentron sinense]|uniref:Sphingomyelin synthase-like domain-containing protein n=1 Tax=Tetracentron sinense TaxID=13715 RepID=A0A835DAD5_TETSI|nr:hypothetical protein HHK36_018493 [Tetracentron sinense]